MNKLIQSLCVVILLFATNQTMAHHSFAAEFSYDNFGEREGEVVEVHFVNPHARIFLSVKNDDGNKEIWSAQTFPPQNLIHRGWNSETIKVGDRIKINGNLGVEHSRRLWIVTITMEDGSVIQPRGGTAN